MLAHGTATVFYGTVGPVGNGQVVTLQVLSGRTWRSLSSARIYRQKLPNGATVIGYKLATKPGRSGRYTYRVYRAATAANAAGASTGIVLAVS